jgi:NAD(P)-dependent dehydrogenase (short-subunit alcohol dehydrogenase family)
VIIGRTGPTVVSLDLSTEVEAPLAGLRCYVTDDVEIRAAVGTITRRFGRLDVLVNNAGIGAQGDITANDDAEWHHVYDVNVVGVARLSRAALGLLRQSPHMAIVNTCSVAPSPDFPDVRCIRRPKGLCTR